MYISTYTTTCMHITLDVCSVFKFVVEFITFCLLCYVLTKLALAINFEIDYF